MEARWKECARVVDDMIDGTALTALDVEELSREMEPVVFIACLVSLKDRRNAMTALQLLDRVKDASKSVATVPAAILDLLSMIYSKGYIVPPCVFIDLEALELVVKRTESDPASCSVVAASIARAFIRDAPVSRGSASGLLVSAITKWAGPAAGAADADRDRKRGHKRPRHQHANLPPPPPISLPMNNAPRFMPMQGSGFGGFQPQTPQYAAQPQMMQYHAMAPPPPPPPPPANPDEYDPANPTFDGTHRDTSTAMEMLKKMRERKAAQRQQEQQSTDGLSRDQMDLLSSIIAAVQGNQSMVAQSA